MFKKGDRVVFLGNYIFGKRARMTATVEEDYVEGRQSVFIKHDPPAYYLSTWRYAEVEPYEIYYEREL